MTYNQIDINRSSLNTINGQKMLNKRQKVSIAYYKFLAGHAFGIQGSSAMVVIEAAPLLLNRFVRIQDLFARLAGIPSLSSGAAGGSPLADLEAAILNGAMALQHEARLPVFDDWVRTPYRVSIDGRPRQVLAMPARENSSSRLALGWAIRTMSMLLDGAPPDPALIERLKTSRKPLLERLSRSAPMGTNAIHFMRAAHRMNLEMNTLPMDIVSFGSGASARWLQSSSTDRTSGIGTALARSKSATSVILRKAGLPVPIHHAVTNADAACKVARKLGFPVVLKPDDQDQGHGVSAGLRTDEGVIEAFGEAAKWSPRVLVEKHHFGGDFRFTVAHDQVVKIFKREAGGVTGDGKHTISELVARANENPRAQRLRLQYGRFLLDLDAEAYSLLQEQGLNADSIPLPDQIVLLRRKNNVSAGGSQSLVEPSAVHPDNIDLAIRAGRALRLDIAGIDLITRDISRSWTQTDAVITEVNAKPQIGISLMPEAYDSILRDIVGPTPNIPVHLCLVSDRNDSPSEPEIAALQASLKAHAVADRSGIRIADVDLPGRFANGFEACVGALMNDRIQSLLCVLSIGEILESGLPANSFDSCKVLGVDEAERASDRWRKVLGMIRPHIPARPLGESVSTESSSQPRTIRPPRVSIIVPSYNRSAYLRETIDSVRSQEFSDWELIVIDDGSTDDTEAVIAVLKAQESRLVYRKQENRGSAAARNHGLSVARGELVAFLDSDDRYLPGGLGALVAAIDSGDGRKLVYGDYRIHDEVNGTVKEVRSAQPLPRPQLALQFLIPRANPILPSATIVERRALQEIGGFDESFRTGQVVELWSRFTRKHDIHKLPTPVTIYRRHSGQVTLNTIQRRYDYDRIGLKTLAVIDPVEWCDPGPAEQTAHFLDTLAKRLMSGQFLLVDTALRILASAQRMAPSKKRALAITSLANNADALLKRHHGAVKRAQPSEQ